MIRPKKNTDETVDGYIRIVHSGNVGHLQPCMELGEDKIVLWAEFASVIYSPSPPDAWPHLMHDIASKREN